MRDEAKNRHQPCAAESSRQKKPVANIPVARGQFAGQQVIHTVRQPVRIVHRAFHPVPDEVPPHLLRAAYQRPHHEIQFVRRGFFITEHANNQAIKPETWRPFLRVSREFSH